MKTLIIEGLASAAILTVALTGGKANAAPPRCDVNEIAYVVERLDVGKRIHLDWAASPQDNPRLEIAGDRAWHLRWASDYDRTVELIKALAAKAC